MNRLRNCYVGDFFEGFHKTGTIQLAFLNSNLQKKGCIILNSLIINYLVHCSVYE